MYKERKRERAREREKGVFAANGKQENFISFSAFLPLFLSSISRISCCIQLSGSSSSVRNIANSFIIFFFLCAFWYCCMCVFM